MSNPANAVVFARLSNNRLSDSVRRHPTRFAGLASFALPDPPAAAKEMERAIASLKLDGFLVDSHTQNGYLDEERSGRFSKRRRPGAPLHSSACAVRRHRRALSATTEWKKLHFGYGWKPAPPQYGLCERQLDGFPRLRIVLGHIGEALPFSLSQLDYIGLAGLAFRSLTTRSRQSEYFAELASYQSGPRRSPRALLSWIRLASPTSCRRSITPYQPSAPARTFWSLRRFAS